MPQALTQHLSVGTHLRPMQIEQLLDTWEKLGVRERKVLLTIAMRLWAGQRRHGELSVGKKDWNYEALEEAMDASVYLACALNDRTEKAFGAMVEDAEREVTATQCRVCLSVLHSTENHQDVDNDDEVRTPECGAV